MLRQRIRGWAEAIYVVAHVAVVEVWSVSKLSTVYILMTVGTGCEFYVVLRVLSRRQMALGAIHTRVFSF